MEYLKALALSILAVLAPIKTVMIVTGVLIFADLILGILAARKRGEPITSAALRRTVSKMIAYQVAIITGFLCEKYLIEDAIPVTKLIAGMIGVVEMKSILENSDTVNGDSVFGSIIKKLGSENDK
jgi:hypothetical protein